MRSIPPTHFKREPLNACAFPDGLIAHAGNLGMDIWWHLHTFALKQHPVECTHLGTSLEIYIEMILNVQATSNKSVGPEFRGDKQLNMSIAKFYNIVPLFKEIPNPPKQSHLPKKTLHLGWSTSARIVGSGLGTNQTKRLSRLKPKALRMKAFPWPHSEMSRKIRTLSHKNGDLAHRGLENIWEYGKWREKCTVKAWKHFDACLCISKGSHAYLDYLIPSMHTQAWTSYPGWLKNKQKLTFVHLTVPVAAITKTCS